MADYVGGAFIFLILLISINSFVIFNSTMPRLQTDQPHLTDGQSNFSMDGTDLNALRWDNNSFLNNVDSLRNQNDSNSVNVDPSTANKNFLESAKEVLFGVPVIGTVLQTGAQVLGVAGIVMGLLLKVFFGYFIWIDYFLRPAWGLAVIGLVFKIVFLIFEAYAVYIVGANLFALGTGARMFNTQ